MRGNNAKVMPNAYKKRYVILRFFNTLLSYDGSAIQPRRKERSSAQFKMGTVVIGVVGVSRRLPLE